MFSAVRKMLLCGQPLRVVFLNDTGFIGGAGIGHRRQIQSFLDAGHSVAAVCWLENAQQEPLPPRGRQSPGTWRRLHSMPQLCHDQGLTDAEITSGVIEKIISLSPDLVISGNFHWARWPITILDALRNAQIPIVAYVHDCHWLTGRCAYPGTCRKYLEKCDISCPTPSEYPPAEPETIEAAWRERRHTFAGKHAIPLFANSKWMCDMAASAFHHRAIVKFAPLGLDISLFSPIDRLLARRLLGLPTEGMFVLAGAVNLRESRKGGALLERVIENIQQRTSAKVVTFGARSDEFRDVISIGVVHDERMMPLIYSAADIMMHTAHEESFGQTLLEASACGIPVIAMAAGGMVDIARHEVNGLTVPQNDPDAYFQAVTSLIENPSLCREMGRAGRAIVEHEYSYSAQYDRWRARLMELSNE